LVLPLQPTTGAVDDPEVWLPGDPAVLEDPEPLVDPAVDVDPDVVDVDVPDVAPVEVLPEPDGLELALLEPVDPDVDVDVPDVAPVEVLPEPDGLELALLEPVDPDVDVDVPDVVPVEVLLAEPVVPLEGWLPPPELPAGLPALLATGAVAEPAGNAEVDSACWADTVAPTSARSRVTKATWDEFASSARGAPSSALPFLMISDSARAGLTISEGSPGLWRMDWLGLSNRCWLTSGAATSSEPSMSVTLVAPSSTETVKTVPFTTETRYGVSTDMGRPCRP
jgi:hypothetical protein